MTKGYNSFKGDNLMLCIGLIGKITNNSTTNYEITIIDTQVRYSISERYGIKLETKSSMAAKGLGGEGGEHTRKRGEGYEDSSVKSFDMVIGGILDSDYEDNIHVIIRNFTQISQTIKSEQKIAQAIILPNYEQI